MSGDIYQIETRRRSRSKTPFLRSSCDHESCDHAGEEGHVHHKRSSVAPNVRTIVEEHIEVTSSSSSTKAGNSLKQDNKLATINLTAEDKNIQNAQNVKQIIEQSAAATTTKIGNIWSSSTATVSLKKAKAKDLAQYSSRKRSPMREVGHWNAEITEETEQVKRMARTQGAEPKEAFKKRRQELITASGRGHRINGYDECDDKREYLNSNDHIAYREYKNAGDYWNKTPKTDYTYSELSPHRRELAPGIVAMPNMSRRSLGNYDERINYLVSQYPKEEAYIRRHYDSKSSQLYDSGDEVDITQFVSARRNHIEKSWWLRIITTVITSVMSVWTSVAGKNHDLQKGHQKEAYRRIIYGRQQQHSVSFFGIVYQGLVNRFWGLCHYVYMFISSVLYLDTILLRSSNAQNRKKKRFFLLLLLLFPLLLLAGIYYSLHPNETFPPKFFSEYIYTLPELPKIDIVQYFPSQEDYDAVKAQTVEKFQYLHDWADDYLLYLKTISQNIAQQGRKLFQGEEILTEGV